MRARFLTIGCLLVLSLLAVSANVLADDASPAGNWLLGVATPDGGTLNLNVTLKQDGDKLTGTMAGDDGVETELADVALKDGKLTFKITRDFNGQELTSTFNGKLDANKFEGTVDYSLGDQQGTLDVTGAREGAKLDLNGTWLLVATSDAGTFEPKLHLKHEEDDVSGKYEWSETSVVEIKDGKIVDEELIFTVTHDFDGQELIVKFKVKPDGDKLAGTADYDLGGQTGTAQIEGSRSQAASVAGTWNISITGENGEAIEATATLAQDGDKISGDYTGPAGEAKVADACLEGNKLKFQVTRDRDGRKLVLNYSGELDGDKLAGDVEFVFDDQTRSTKFEAKREK